MWVVRVHMISTFWRCRIILAEERSKHIMYQLCTAMAVRTISHCLCHAYWTLTWSTSVCSFYEHYSQRSQTREYSSFLSKYQRRSYNQNCWLRFSQGHTWANNASGKQIQYFLPSTTTSWHTSRPYVGHQHIALPRFSSSRKGEGTEMLLIVGAPASSFSWCEYVYISMWTSIAELLVIGLQARCHSRRPAAWSR